MKKEKKLEGAMAEEKNDDTRREKENPSLGRKKERWPGEKERERWQRGERFSRGESHVQREGEKKFEEIMELGAIFTTRRERKP